jgi:hypothetical protein
MEGGTTIVVLVGVVLGVALADGGVERRDDDDADDDDGEVTEAAGVCGCCTAGSARVGENASIIHVLWLLGSNAG